MRFSQHKFFSEKARSEPVRFLMAGGLATAVQYVLLVFLVELSILAPVAASLVSYLIAALGNYLLNYYFTFASNANHRVALARFLTVAGVGFSANGGIMYVGTEYLQFHYLAVQISATLIVLVWNFLAHKFWTYQSVPVNGSSG
jgi:putative flippase GtrA